jgi:hypothetical protein
MNVDDSEMPSFVFPDGVLAREVEGEMVLLNLTTERYYGLDAVGADIVTRLTQGSMTDALASLIHDYEVDGDVLRPDVDHLVGELEAAGLLERTQARP